MTLPTPIPDRGRFKHLILTATDAQRAVALGRSLLDAAVFGHKLSEVIATVAFVVTALLGGYHFVTRSHGYHSLREMFVRWDLRLMLGDVKGTMVYEGLRQNFPASKRRMAYRVQLSDTPFEDSPIGAPFRRGDYLFFKAALDFDRVQPDLPSEIMIAAITDLNKLPEWIKRPDVIFREVIGFNDADRPWVEEVMRRIDTDPDVSRKADRHE